MQRSAIVLVGLLGCGVEAPGEDTNPSSGSAAGSSSGASDGATSVATVSTTEGVDETGTPTTCACAPGTDVIHVLSDAGELFAFDPLADVFTSLGPIACGDYRPFSMAVDREGFAWVLLLDDIPLAAIAKGMFRIDLSDPSSCTPVPYEDGLFGIFGMSFVGNPPPDACESFYVFSYSGSGPFAEGPGLGTLGVLDPESSVLEVIGPVDFDGGELAGTGDGRLVAVAGVDPIKLIAYDEQDASELARIELDGVARTGASALAFFAGGFYLFTEAGPPACTDCLEQACGDELAACQADPECAPVLECLLTSQGDGPGCKGDLPGAAGLVRDCMFNSCTEPCSASQVRSRVRRVEWDAEGSAFTMTEREALAPVRIVGAGSSTCVPVNVP